MTLGYIFFNYSFIWNMIGKIGSLSTILSTVTVLKEECKAWSLQRENEKQTRGSQEPR